MLKLTVVTRPTCAPWDVKLLPMGAEGVCGQEGLWFSAPGLFYFLHICKFCFLDFSQLIDTGNSVSDVTSTIYSLA